MMSISGKYDGANTLQNSRNSSISQLKQKSATQEIMCRSTDNLKQKLRKNNDLKQKLNFVGIKTANNVFTDSIVSSCKGSTKA